MRSALAVALVTAALGAVAGVRAAAAAATPAPVAVLAVDAAAPASGIDPALVPFLPVFDAPTNRGLKPTRWAVLGTLAYYQIPEDPVGTLVTFHGCARYAKAFWPWHPVDCNECFGYPEHVSQTKQALARGYAVLALDPLDKAHQCWSSSKKGQFQNDQGPATAIIRAFLSKHGLKRKPLVFLGTSSGGTLALKLAVSLFRQAQQAKRGEWVPQPVGVVSEEAVSDFGAMGADGKLALPGFPPVFFVCMQRGGSRLEAPGMTRALRDGGTPAEFVVSPIRQVSPSYFSDRIPAITRQQSEWIAAGMRHIGMLDADGWLLGDPERSKAVLRNTTSPAFGWDGKLKALLPWLADDSPTLTLLYRPSGIQQALNVAYNRHDAISDYLTAALIWIEGGGKGNMTELLELHTVKDFNLTALTADRVWPDGEAPEAPPPAAEGPAEPAGGAPEAAPGPDPAPMETRLALEAPDGQAAALQPEPVTSAAVAVRPLLSRLFK